jgi:hypothetical protein
MENKTAAIVASKEEEEEEEIKPHVCPLCTALFPSLLSLSVHFRKGHKKPSKELYILLNGSEPRCACGCGEKTKFLGIREGFREYIRGHAARVNNNWGHNQKAREKSLETRKKMIEDGTFHPFFEKETGQHWAQGKTKETNKSIKKMAENRSADPRLSERAKKYWKDGTFKGKSGPEHSQWKGGIAPLHTMCSSSKRLYKEWKRPFLEAARFACQECGKDFYNNGNKNPKLNVHHNQESMSSIVISEARRLGWADHYAVATPYSIETFQLKQEIIKAVTDYHLTNKVSGIVLCHDCHKKKHKSLNF